jgi:integrase
MPLKLRPPRAGKTPYYEIRGTYLGVAVERSTRTDSKRLASQILRQYERRIERGDLTAQATPAASPAAHSFLAAAVAYMKAGGEGRFLGPIIEHTGPAAIRDKLLTEIDQVAMDTAAGELYPTAGPATRNRQFYSPVLAVLHHGGIDRRFRRPKGWRGNKSTAWLEPDQAFALFRAADRIDAEFGLFLRVLCYTGMRLGDALGARLGQLNLDRGYLYLPRTKNNEPRAVYLPPALRQAFAHQPPRPGRQGGRQRADAGVRFLERGTSARLFRFTNSGHLRGLLKQALAAAGLAFPRRQGGFHLFCHTYGTWMHRYGELDTFGLTRTDRWSDPRSADRYRHGDVSEESRRADWLPVEPKKSKRRSPTDF